MIAIGRGLPFGSPTGEQEPGAGRVQIVDGPEQSGHPAGGQDDAMEGAICFFPRLHVARTISRPVRFLGLIEDSLGQMRNGIAKRQGFERGTHLRDLTHLFQTESCDTHTSAGLADNQPLRFQTAEGLANRDVASTKFFGDVILP